MIIKIVKILLRNQAMKINNNLEIVVQNKIKIKK